MHKSGFVRSSVPLRQSESGRVILKKNLSNPKNPKQRGECQNIEEKFENGAKPAVQARKIRNNRETARNNEEMFEKAARRTVQPQKIQNNERSAGAQGSVRNFVCGGG